MTVAAPRHAFETIALDARARAALLVLGDEIRRVGPDGWCAEMLSGAPVARDVIEAQVPAGVVAALVESGLADIEGDHINFVTTIAVIGGVLTAMPKARWGPEVVYIGPDSAHLIEAVVRLAPRGARAAELGTGTGLLAAILATRYVAVIATDVGDSVALAAAVTVALNRYPDHRAPLICMADVAHGLRPGSFDLVTGNSPWVPIPASSDRPRELFSYGGETGVEIPRRFLLEGAALLRAGGVSITLALDVELHDGRRPLSEAVEDLQDLGMITATLPTPWNRERPQFVDVARARQPAIVDAEHVAVVAARPREPGDRRAALFAAVEGLRSRWATRDVARQNAS